MAYTFKHGDRPINGYTVQRAVGRGGFGEVYYAVSDGGREVALKYLRDNPDIELRGVGHCMNLKSPHLVTIFDVNKSPQGEYFITMEYVQGPSLRDLLIAEPNGLGPQKAAFFIRELTKGLAYLHDRGIVHRDMKPGNIFYDEGYVKIGDYGLSKFISVSRHSVQTASVGTVHYMAPEVGSGNYHRGIDIYALGVMLYEMLLGRVPYQGSSMGEVLMKHLTTQPEVDELPEPFGSVIRKALAKDPNDRYQNVHEMADDLLAVENVKDSLVGFDAATLTVVAHRKFDQHESPAPSPNPPPPPPVALPAPRAGGVANAAAAVGHAPAAGWSPTPQPAGQYPGQPAANAAYLAPEAAAGQIHYAGFWIRFVAAFIDVVIVGIASGIIPGDPFPLFLVLYDGLMIGRWNGQTLGKKVCGIKVISADGRPCGHGQAFGRALAGILSILTLFIGYIMAAFDRQKRALHDHVAGTIHIYAAQR